MQKCATPLLIIFVLLVAGCGSGSDNPASLTVATSIQTSEAEQSLAVVGPLSEIILTFNAFIDADSVPGNISLQIVKTGDEIESTVPEVEILADEQNLRQVRIKTVDGAPLASGEEYKLIVGTAVKAISGISLAGEYVRYFATDYHFSLQNLLLLDNTRNMTVVISDIHMGDRRSIDQGYGWFDNNRDKLASFLAGLRDHPNVKALVIAGDLFDEWVAPMGAITLDGKSQSEFIDDIARTNEPVISAINAIIADGQIVVTYVPGNHDMLVTSKAVQQVFPGISEARDNAPGIGAYSPEDCPELIIEHGHRYDFFNAPDPISNRSITQTDSILSPGFFVTKIATSSDQETGESGFYRDKLDQDQDGLQSSYLTYWAAWQAIMASKPVRESWDAKMIKTGIDGYSDVYAIDDLIPHHSDNGAPLDVTLYKDIENNWPNRQAANQVRVPITVAVAIAAGALNKVLDAQCVSQYFFNSDSNKRIVVFGHTHEAKLAYFINLKGQWTIYANSGTWIDNSELSCTFVTITPQKKNGATTDTVSLYQYIDDDLINKIDSAAIRR